MIGLGTDKDDLKLVAKSAFSQAPSNLKNRLAGSGGDCRTRLEVIKADMLANDRLSVSKQSKDFYFLVKFSLSYLHRHKMDLSKARSTKVEKIVSSLGHVVVSMLNITCSTINILNFKNTFIQ